MEVKQTLGFEELDSAMEKLVKISRLQRPENPYGHITENQHIRSFDEPGHILNPLHTTVLGTRLKSGLSFSDIALRFGKINSNLNRSEMVTALCLLDQGVAVYLTEEEPSHYVQASYMWDRQDPLVMGIYDEPDKAFHMLFIHLLGHLTRSVLSSPRPEQQLRYLPSHEQAHSLPGSPVQPARRASHKLNYRLSPTTTFT